MLLQRSSRPAATRSPERHDVDRPPPRSPHIVLFLSLNLFYYLPLLLVFLFGYEEGGAAQVVAFPANTMIEISVVYAIGMIAFVLGAHLPDWLQPDLKLRSAFRPFSWTKVTVPTLIGISFISIVFLASKVALIPLGVYGQYAFNSGVMSNGVWTFSMVCSEVLLLMSVFVLFSTHKHNILLFELLSALNGVNLLHGTRIFFMITLSVALLYAYVRRILTIRKMLLYIPLGFGAVSALAFLVFVRRSDVSLAEGISVSMLLSPLVYESLFTQWSLINVLSLPHTWTLFGQPMSFLFDSFVMTVPRLLLPDKDILSSSAKWGDLSPLGAFSGYADGLLYFGILFPLFYFLVGMLLTSLYRRSFNSSFRLVLYAYMTADLMFRIMRDGYCIPIKMGINALEVLALFYFCGLRVRHKAVPPKPPAYPGAR